tara:strand:- start:1015 stop:1698 length:684 start_codon:yes stop_codon:yes gene_type:complete
MMNELFRVKTPDEGESLYQKERRTIVFVVIFVLIFIFDAAVLRTIDPERLIDQDETSKDWMIEISMIEQTETVSEELSANQMIETTIDLALSEQEYLQSVSIIIQCSDEDEPGEGFSDEINARTDLSAVEGGPADKEESGSCLENTEDDVVLTWTFMNASSVESNQSDKTQSEVWQLFEQGKTGTGTWSAEIELQVVTAGGVTALDSGEQVTVTWVVSTFEVDLRAS